MSQRLTEFDVGNVVTRVEPCKISGSDGKVDNSYMGDKFVITRKGDKWVECLSMRLLLGEPYTKIFTYNWLDGWEKVSDSEGFEHQTQARINAMLFKN